MKNFFITALGLFWGFQCAEAAEEKIIRISTDNTVLVLQVAETDGSIRLTWAKNCCMNRI